jgi:iron complex outermembrane recepter protein
VATQSAHSRLLTRLLGRLRSAVGSGALGFALVGQAQVPAPPSTSPEPTLEELLLTEVAGGSSNVAVSTAGRMAQSADLAPAVTEVITWQEIQRLGLRSMGDVLRRLSGVQARATVTSTNMVVRGVGPGNYNNRVLVLLDGMRLNDNLYDALPIDRDFPVDVSQIERVEFTPGPGSALYGGNALLGVVNVVTFRADQLRGGRMQVRQAPAGHSEAALSYGRRLDDGSEWVFLASWLNDPRPEVLFERTSEEARQIQPYEWDHARRASLSYRREGLLLRAGADDRVQGLAAALDDGSGYLQTDLSSLHRYAQTSYEGQLGAGWDLSASLAWQQLLYRSDSPYLDEEGVQLNDRFEALGRWLNGELRVGHALGQSHYLMVGVDAQRDILQTFRFDVQGPDFSSITSKGYRLGLFVQDEWRLGERQRLVLGVRRDAASQKKHRWNPRLAYVWSPAEGSSLKFAYGSAYRDVNQFEAVSNRLVELPLPYPERVRSFDLSWDGQWGRVWRYRVSTYRMRVLDPIESDLFGFGFFVNTGQIRSSGLELGAEARWPSGWQFGFKWSTERALQGQDRIPVSYSPKQILRWSASTPIWKRWQLALNGEIYQRRAGFLYDHGGYGLLHANVLWRLAPGLTASLGAQNVTDKRYVESVSETFDTPLTRQGRRWLLNLQWQVSP